MLFLLGTVQAPPSEAICESVAQYEHQMQKGEYEVMVKVRTKFDSIESQASRNAELQAEWGAIKSGWDISLFADQKGLVRRSLTAERNLRPDLQVVGMIRTNASRRSSTRFAPGGTFMPCAAINR